MNEEIPKDEEYKFKRLEYIGDGIVVEKQYIYLGDGIYIEDENTSNNTLHEQGEEDAF